MPSCSFQQRLQLTINYLAQYNLAWKIALASKGMAAPGLLATYDIERMPIAAQMLAATTALYKHLVPGKAEGAAQPQSQTDGAADPTKSGFMQWRNRALTQLEINYRFSPIVLDARGSGGRTEDEMRARAYDGYGPEGGVRAGDRAPDAPGLVDAAGKETSLFDVFKPTVHTILVFVSGKDGEDAKVATIVEEAKKYPGGTVQVVVIGLDGVPVAALDAKAYHDKDGLAAGAYRVDDDAPRVVVVSPDAYVGAFVNDVAGVRDYFTKIFNGM